MRWGAAARRAFGACGLLLVLGRPGDARAQAPPRSESQRAVAVGYEALSLYERGDWAEAFARFVVADRLSHSPVFVLYQARARRNAGALVEARRLFERVASEPLPAEAPSSWRAAVRDAGSERSALQLRVPVLRLRVAGTHRPPLTLERDGRAERLPGTEAILQLDPGEHRIRVLDASGAEATLHLSLREAERRAIELQLSARPDATAGMRANAAGGSGAAPMPTGDRAGPDAGEPLDARDVTTAALLSVGAAGLTLGAITGALAWVSADEIKENCSGTDCRFEDAGKGRSATRLANAATAALVVGGGSLAAGLTLLAWPRDEGSAELRLGTHSAKLLVSGSF